MTRQGIVTRRDLLTRGLGIVGVGAALPDFLVRSALAGPKESVNGRIIVSLLLTGGPDGLSLVPPYGDDEYYRQRKNLGIAAGFTNASGSPAIFAPSSAAWLDAPGSAAASKNDARSRRDSNVSTSSAVKIAWSLPFCSRR